MKKYYFEAAKRQLEKATEPLYIHCATAKTFVFAESDEEALRLATEKLNDKYFGSGTVLGEVKMIASYNLPIDGKLVGNNVIR